MQQQFSADPAAAAFAFNSPTPVKRLDTSSFNSLNEFITNPGVQAQPQVYELRTLQQQGGAAVHSLITPVKGGGGRAMAVESTAAFMMEPMSAFSMPASALESAGKQDEVIRLKGALNEKEMELIELREQHMQLVARSQEARSNWETALEAKDRAIDQLEEALASRQRALDAASRNAAAGQEEVAQGLSAAQARMRVLEANLAEAHSTVMSQSQTIADQGRQLEAARQAKGQEASASDARVRALQQELASSQHQQVQLQREVKQLQALAAEKDGRLGEAAAAEQRLRQQVDQAREALQEAEGLARQQPQRVQQQLSELTQQLQVVQARAAAKEASSRKYKEAVRAFKVKLQERDEALAQRQAQVLELHTELSQLQRLFKVGPLGAAAAAAAGGCAAGAAACGAQLRASWKGGAGLLPSCGCGSPNRSPGGRPQFSRGGSAEDAVAAATDELERLRSEVHGFHLELAALQGALADKEALLQGALDDARSLDAERAAAAARAEEATSAAFGLERQLREAQGAAEAAETARAKAAEALAAAEARLAGLQADQANGIRMEGQLRARVVELQEQLEAREGQATEAQRALKEAQQREADAARRIHALEARAEGLEAKLDVSSSASGQAQRRADRQESEAAGLAAQLEALQQRSAADIAALHERLQQQQQNAAADAAALLGQLEAARSELRGAEAAVADEQVRARELHLTCSTQMRELEVRVQEAIRQAQQADVERQALEAAVAAAEAQAAAAQQRSSDAESQVLLLGRSLREAEAAVLDWQLRARHAEESRQELTQLVGSSEAAVKQMQSDLAQMQLAHSSERGQATAQQQQLQRALADAQAARADADARVRDSERLVSDMRHALDSQERLLLVLREEVAAGGTLAARAGELEAHVQVLQGSLEEARHTIAALRSAAASADGHSQTTVAGLLAELAEKSSQLVEAERRCSQLEALMQRIASRMGPDQAAAEGWGAGGGCSSGGGGLSAAAGMRDSWARRSG